MDVQNDFADPKGSLSVRGALDVIPVINREIALARAGGAFVVLSQDWHPTARRTSSGTAVRGRSTASPRRGARSSTRSSTSPSGTPIVRKGSNGEDGYSAFTMRDAATGIDVPTMLGPLLETAGVARPWS